MRLLKHLLSFSALLVATAGTAHAGAAATHNQYCETTDSFGMGTGNVVLVEGKCPNGRAVGDRVIVQVGPEAGDAGKTGAIYIGLLRNGEVLGQFTVAGGSSSTWRPPLPSMNAKTGEWISFRGGLYTPTERYAELPAPPQAYVLIDGPSMCATAGGGDLELFAGYGALDQQEVELLQHMKAVVSRGITEDHLMMTRIQNDMTKKQRVWKVLQLSCPSYSAPAF